MKILNLFKIKSKKSKRMDELYKRYENGEILQVDNGIDNKAYILNKREQRG